MQSNKNASKYAIPVRINSDDNVYMPATVFSESKKSLERSHFFRSKIKPKTDTLVLKRLTSLFMS